MMTVKEVSRITGVSVRTLHHYDAVGLLKPSALNGAGYRLYDSAALSRLQSILLFKELRFSLKEIKQILDSPDYDPSEALAQQIELLEMQRRRLEELISFARQIQEKGAEGMNFNAFDRKEIEDYEAEVKKRWGHTEAYREYEQRKEAAFGENSADLLMAVFTKLGSLKRSGRKPEDPEVQEMIRSLQKTITDHYYTCTEEILRGLGQMYVYDERFRKNIDSAGGDGTAEFAKQAIEICCAEE